MDRKNKILHIITGLGNGGAEGALFRLVINDKKNIHEVISLSSEGKYAKLLRENNIEVYVTPIKNPLSFLNLFKKILERKPDLVQTWMYHADLIGGILAKLAGYKVVWGIRNTALNTHTSKWTTLLVAKLCAAISSFIPDKIITPAFVAKDFHISYGYDAEKFHVIPNGYIIPDFIKEKVTNEPLKFGMVARFDPFKDHKNLIMSLSLLKAQPEWRCLLVGPGVETSNKELMNWIKFYKLEDKIDLLGPLDNIPQFMREIDFHVLSSNSEAFPNVLAEAMASETPCVSTDVGDASAIILDTGFIVPPRNPNELASAITNFLEMPKDKRLKLGVNARQRIVENYTLEKMVTDYQLIYNYVIDSNS